jgi:hypothetical protein
VSTSSVHEMLTAQFERDVHGNAQYLAWEEHLLHRRDFFKTGHYEGTNALLYNRGHSDVGSAYAGAGIGYVFNRYSSAWGSAESNFRVNLDSLLGGIRNWGSTDLFGAL